MSRFCNVLMMAVGRRGKKLLYFRCQLTPVLTTNVSLLLFAMLSDGMVLTSYDLIETAKKYYHSLLLPIWHVTPIARSKWRTAALIDFLDCSGSLDLSNCL